MNTIKKTSTAKRKLPNPPKPKTYTIRQLSEHWKGWSESEIEGFIRDGYLKEAFDAAELGHKICDVNGCPLSDFYLYKCKAGPEKSNDGRDIRSVLMECVDPKVKDNVIKSPKDKENIILGSDVIFLYMPKSEKAIEKLENKSFNYVHFFYDLDGSLLIPLFKGGPFISGVEDGYHMPYVSIPKDLFDLLIIPREEVERFENEHKQPSGKVVTKRQKYILEIMKKDLNLDFGNLPYSPTRAGIKNKVWEIFDKKFEENFERYEQRRNAFDLAWEPLFTVNGTTKMYEPTSALKALL